MIDTSCFGVKHRTERGFRRTSCPEIPGAAALRQNTLQAARSFFIEATRGNRPARLFSSVVANQKTFCRL